MCIDSPGVSAFFATSTCELNRSRCWDKAKRETGKEKGWGWGGGRIGEEGGGQGGEGGG